MENKNMPDGCGRSLLLMITCGTLVGVHVTWWGTKYALDYSTRLIDIGAGYDAAVMFMTYRQTLWQAALLAGLYALLVRLVNAKTISQTVEQLVALFRLFLSVYLSTRIGRALGLTVASFVPHGNEAMGILCGWRVFQIVNLVALVGSVPLLLVVTEWAQERILHAKSWRRRFCISVMVVILGAGVFALTKPNWRLGTPEECEEVEEEEDTGTFDDFRLSEDEPGESVV